MKKIKILILEDSPDDVELVKRELRKGGIDFSSEAVDNKKDFIMSLEEFKPDLILADYKVPSFEGLNALEITRDKYPELPFIYVSGVIDENFAIETLKRGANGYVLKDRLHNLTPTIKRVFEELEEKYPTVVEHMDNVIFTLDAEGNFTYIGPDIEKISGHKAEELLDKHYSHLVHPDDLAGLSGSIKHTLNGEKEYKEFRIFGKDGDIFYLSSSSQPIMKEGEVVGIGGLLTDITERKKVEESLKESEEYQKTILSTIQTGIVVVDENTHEIIYLNKVASELIGTPEEEIIGNICHKFICPAEEGKCPITDLNQVVDNSERVLLDSNGNEIPIIKSVVPVTLKGHKCLLESFIDITNVKNVEKALKMEKVKFMTLAENAPFGMVLIYKDGTYKYINPKFKEIFGYDLEDIPNEKEWSKKAFPSPKYRKRVIKTWVDDFKDAKPGEKQPRIFNVTCKNGEIKTIKFITGFMETGEYLMSVEDITQQKKAENSLKKSENMYKTLFEDRGISTIIIEEDTTVSLINKEFESLSGYTKEEIEGKRSWTEFAAEDDREKMKEYHRLRRIDPNSAPKTYDARLIDKKGKIKEVIINATLIPGTDKSLVSILDNTDRKKSEKQIKESLKEKELLLREIHHRVKNNLQIISSLLSLQSKYIDDKEMNDIFDECMNRVKSISYLHEGLYQSKNLTKINIDEYIRRLTTDLIYSYGFDKKPLKLNIKIEDISLNIETATPLGLIISEIVSNSLKHAFPDEKDGELNIELYSKDDQFILIVSDNGEGFPEDLDFRNTESLGMQLVNSLVEQLDGTIELDKSQGTKFIITFKELEYNKRI